jgi:DNA-directed RNA polymerase specialized sigma24 family protein
MHPSKQKYYLTNRHNDWIRIAKSFGADDYAEDLVQEMYIRTLKYIDNGKDLSYKNDINYLYIYQMLRHMAINLLLKKRKVSVINIDNVKNQTKSAQEINIEKIYVRINKELDRMFWYDAKIYRIIESGESKK